MRQVRGTIDGPHIQGQLIFSTGTRVVSVGRQTRKTFQMKLAAEMAQWTMMGMTAVSKGEEHSKTQVGWMQ